MSACAAVQPAARPNTRRDIRRRISMVFNSLTFLLFFAVVLAVHHAPLPWRVKKLHLLLASYVFYAAWNPPFVVILWLSTLTDWFVARALDRAVNRRRLLLAISLGVNLGLLAFFKYADFLLDTFVAAAASIGIAYEPVQFDIVLPVGISFYTFQTLSYTLDVYFRRMKPADSFLDYALYVTFFPQLVAGPIVRASEFLPMCRRPRQATGAQFGWGLTILVIGLFQKVVVADRLLAPVVDAVYRPGAVPDPAAAWAGTLAFAGQIFCDFAGYSSCAIGAAMCLGFALPDNFRCPYAAIGFSDFWRRWHISLSTWLRDYLYVPLGGNRRGPRRTSVNLMATMLIGGLWHGPSWTFVAWGGLHGLLLVLERRLRRSPLAGWSGWQQPAGRGALALLTFLAICLTWVFFRAETFAQAGTLLAAMCGLAAEPTLAAGQIDLPETLAVMAALLAVHWHFRDRSLEAAVEHVAWWGRSLTTAGLLIAIVLLRGDSHAFIYFQF